MTNQSLSTSINTVTSTGSIVWNVGTAGIQHEGSTQGKSSSVRSRAISQFSTRTFRDQSNLQPEACISARHPRTYSVQCVVQAFGIRITALDVRKYFTMKCQKKTATNTRLDKHNIPYFIRQNCFLWCCVSLRHANPCCSFQANDGFSWNLVYHVLKVVYTFYNLSTSNNMALCTLIEGTSSN